MVLEVHCLINRGHVLQTVPDGFPPILTLTVSSVATQVEIAHLHFTLYRVHCTVYSVQCTVYSVHCTLYTVHPALYTAHCTLYIIHSTLYTLQCILLTRYCPCTHHPLQCSISCTLYTVYYTTAWPISQDLHLWIFTVHIYIP